MSHPALTRRPLTGTVINIAPHSAYILALGFSMLGGAFYMPESTASLVFLAVGATMVALAVLVRLLFRRYQNQQKSLQATVSGFVEHDASPSFTTNRDGAIGFRNKAAKQRFGSAQDEETLLQTLGDVFASPAATLNRLQKKAMVKGSAREDVVMRRGHLRMSVHQLGDDGFLWRLEDIAERPNPSRTTECVSLPMMTVSKTGTVLFMNDALRRLLGGREATLDRIFNDLPLKSGAVHEIAGVEGPLKSLVCSVESTAGRSEIYLLPFDDQNAPIQSAGGSLFDQLPVPLMKVAPDGKIRLCNQAACTLLGGVDAKSDYLADMVEGLGRSVRDWLMDAASKQADLKSEILRASRQTKEVFVQISLSRVEEDGETLLYAVLHDATKLKTLEAQFVQSQKMQAIGQLAGGVAHDFNNLLTAISGHCDLLLLRHDNGDPEYSDLVQINQNANRAASLVGQLLAFSRKQTLKPEIVEIPEALDELGHLLNRLVGEKVTLSLSHDADLMPIRADKRQLEQVIMNLVVNARDAMPDGGVVSIGAKMETFQEPFSKDRAQVPAGDYVVVSVSDQGVGIAADKLPKIFEPFFTTKRPGEGTGLGLSMAYGIVKQTGGYIFADSTAASGTCFTLYFPAHVGQIEAQPVAPAPVPRSTHAQEGGVVLLVEDEAPVRAFASRALTMRGYTVLEAENAEAALKTLEDKELEVDVFVTDVIMPGMDGPSWVAQALKDRPDVKVVFVSGYAEESFAEQQARIPNSVFLPKPFSLTELTATVQDQIH